MHCVSCPSGGLPTVWQNEVRDITAEMLTKIRSNVSNETHLERLSGKILALRTSISGDEGRQIKFWYSAKYLQEARSGKKREMI